MADKLRPTGWYWVRWSEAGPTYMALWEKRVRKWQYTSDEYEIYDGVFQTADPPLLVSERIQEPDWGHSIVARGRA